MATETKPQSTAVATTEKRPLTAAVNELITSKQAREYIEPFLPAGTDIQRVAASLVLAMKKDESGMLRKCTPESLIMGMAKIQQWRAEIGESAYLLPFKNKSAGTVEAVPVRSYTFLAELSAACGFPLEAKVVRAGDEFAYKFGLEPVLDHRPVGKNKAPITHVWCIVHQPRNRTPIFDVMTAEDVEEIRQKYSKQWKEGPLQAWYAKKSIIRRVVKLLPKDPKLARLIQAVQEDAHEELEEDVPLLSAAAAAPTARIEQAEGDQEREAGEEYEDFDDRDLVEE